MYNAKERKRTEALFETLGNADDAFLYEAFSIDNVGKMARLKKEDKIKKRSERSEYVTLYKVIACFACLLTVVGIVLNGYIRENSVPVVDAWDGFEMIEGEVKIDGIDALNYYSARRILSVGREGTAVSAVSVPLSYSVTSSGDDVKDGDGGVYYYEFDPAWDYTVTRVVYFRAELKEENGFLAEKLGGIGEVDVIITENSIDDMITFKRGARYYSCHVNSCLSQGKTEWIEFSTHKYIDGFCMVKDAVQDNYVFKILLEKGRVTEIDCDYGECRDGVWDREADRIGIIDGSTMISEKTYTFNITELEQFFNTVVSQKYLSDAVNTRRRRVEMKCSTIDGNGGAV